MNRYQCLYFLSLFLLAIVACETDQDSEHQPQTIQHTAIFITNSQGLARFEQKFNSTGRVSQPAGPSLKTYYNPNQQLEAWYTDTALNQRYNFRDTKPSPQGIILYAKWKNSTGPTFKTPISMVYANGLFYIADAGDNHIDNGKVIYKVNPATGRRQVFSLAEQDKHEHTGNKQVATGPSLGHMKGMTLVGNKLYVLTSLRSVVAVDLDNGKRTALKIGGQARLSQAYSITSNARDALFIGDRGAQAIIKVDLNAADPNNNASVYSSAKRGASRGKTANGASFITSRTHNYPHELAPFNGLLYHNGTLYAAVTGNKIATVAPNGDRDYLKGTLVGQFAMSLTTDGNNLFIIDNQGRRRIQQILSQMAFSGANAVKQTVKGRDQFPPQTSSWGVFYPMQLVHSLFSHPELPNIVWVLDDTYDALLGLHKQNSGEWTITVWSK